MNIAVHIKTDSHYKINRKRVRNLVTEYLEGKKVKGKTEVSIAVVGNRQMKILNNLYRHLDKTSNVLAFSQLDVESGEKFIDPPDGILRLGDIVISYPQVIDEASEEDKLVDDKIDELIIHGINNLLGMEGE